MTDPDIHTNILINAEVDEDNNNPSRDTTTDTERLLQSRPRNNFQSYSNDDVNVRFRVRKTSNCIGKI